MRLVISTNSLTSPVLELSMEHIIIGGNEHGQKLELITKLDC